MELGKYYTPSIEEFHVGFEYERWLTAYSYPVEHLDGDKFKVLADPEQTMSWQRIICDTNDLEIIEIVLDERPNEIRVKYLDKADIESLGWECIEDRGMSENYGYSFQKPIEYLSGGTVYYRLRYWYTTHRVRIEPLGAPIFDGIIKNKSELKRLLKQLGILE